MLNVKEYVKERKKEIKNLVSQMALKPNLLIVQVGDNEASNKYVKGKIKDCEEVGLRADILKFDTDISNEDICHEVSNRIKDYYGIIIQLPLPTHINKKELLNIVPYCNDVDGLTSDSKFTPCTPLGILKYIDYLNYDLKGKVCLVIGRSELVGRPMCKLLDKRNATIINCNSYTPKSALKKLCKAADVIISAAGKRNLITKDMVNPEQLVIDVGINFDENGKMCGDVSREVYDVVDKATPVPGGVGLLTRLALLENLLDTIIPF